MCMCMCVNYCYNNPAIFAIMYVDGVCMYVYVLMYVCVHMYVCMYVYVCMC